MSIVLDAMAAAAVCVRGIDATDFDLACAAATVLRTCPSSAIASGPPGSLAIFDMSVSVTYARPLRVVTSMRLPLASWIWPNTAFSPNVRTAFAPGWPSTLPTHVQLPSSCSAWRSYLRRTGTPSGVDIVISPLAIASMALLSLSNTGCSVVAPRCTTSAVVSIVANVCAGSAAEATVDVPPDRDRWRRLRACRFRNSPAAVVGPDSFAQPATRPMPAKTASVSKLVRVCMALPC